MVERQQIRTVNPPGNWLSFAEALGVGERLHVVIFIVGFEVSGAGVDNDESQFIGGQHIL